MKVYRITGRILGKEEPMFFRKEYRALKKEDALEYLYSEMGSKHHVKRTLVKVEKIEEIPEDEAKDPVIQSITKMY
ncbi:MAG TPA: 50S ribosomal protein L18a [Methanothermococcus okinawensis]|uniref:Large ribosomal subunit protein eL20 n=1 Tax=Methanothermococcus okinawensis TaxID=155863 RepID=A0A832ZKL2_9EURY|nr:50S ribosomal protein L18a [Methanothermococcus okinawensis]HIP91212.1 50S ribosomal protein L18a [Methanothermococcus okinawensis]